MAHSSDEDQLLDLNRRTFEAEDAHDSAALASILDEEFVLVRAKLRADGDDQANKVKVRGGAIQTRVQLLATVSADTRSLSRHRHEVCVHVIGDSAVVACRIELLEAGQLLGQYWNTQVYSRRDGEWRCVDWRVAHLP